MFRHLIITAIICIATQAETDPNFRLNTPIRPSSYEVTITPYFDTWDNQAFTFDGSVTIYFTTEESTSLIKLHAEDLIFSSENITVASGDSLISFNAVNPLTFDTRYAFAYIELATPLVAETRYSLNILYRGPIRTDLNGFYRNYYIENGVKKWLGATQMEPTHARKVFPSFDEPGLKATFSLTIDRPESYKPSLANTKMLSSTTLNNGYVRETFYPTPRMSTYLVAFLVSEFEAGNYSTNGNQEFGIFTRPEATNQTAYPFDFGTRVVNALGDYFGINYYSTNDYLKLDHVALPDFRAGAMENWGLIKYRESLLLYVPDVSEPYYKYRVAQIVAHETTHMWFGNLVTCHWWSNTWLNEGFANYFQDYITSLIEPDVGAADILVTGSVYSAYDADDSKDSPAITNDDVNSPAEISGHFGTVTYQKAGSVIRMIHHLLGDEAFKFGLNAYLSQNQFDSGYPDRLYSALESGVVSANALSSYPGANITDVMSSWITQAGHPVLHVNVNYEDETISLSQERFYIDSKDSSEEKYMIPITYTTAISPDFDTTKPAFIMEDKTHTFSIANISQNHPWILFNVQETGLYRVNYDDHSWQMIASALRGEDREKIHHLNRAKIVNDVFAFLYADVVDFERVYDILQFLSEEDNYSVWLAAIRGLNKLRSSFLGTDALDTIEAYELKLLDSAINKLGYEVRAGEGTVALRNRGQVLELACKLGHQECINHAVALFRDLKDNGTEITPSLRTVAYCNGLRYGTGDDYDFLWRRMATTNVANEARLIGDTLACTTDEEKLKHFLVSMMEEESPIRTQDLTVPLTTVLRNYSNVHLVLHELRDSYTLWKTIYPTMDTVFTAVASALHTEEDIEEFENFLSSCSDCSEDSIKIAKTALEAAKASSDWAKNHIADILKNLESHGFLPTPSFFVLFLGLIVVYNRF